MAPSRCSNLRGFAFLLVGIILGTLRAFWDSTPCALESLDDGVKEDDRAVPTIPDELVRDIANDDCHGERQCSDNNTDGPLDAIDGDNRERGGTNEDDEDLTTNHYSVDAQEKVVLEHTLEDVEFVVETTIAILVSIVNYECQLGKRVQT